MKYILETERLRLRTLTREDTAFIIELLNSPGWLQYIGDRGVRTEENALAFLENGPFKSYRQHGYGLWLVESKADGRPLGMCGILRRDALEHPDIGFAFLPEYTGKGYALEVASATVRYAKDTLAIPILSAIALPNNTNSIRLLEKLGLHFVRTLCLPGSEEELLLYSHPA